MRRRFLRLAVLVTSGLFGACATAEDPGTQAPTPTPTLDASADRNVAKDTGVVVVDDAGEEDAGAVAKDAGKDAKTDAGDPDTGTIDAGDPDTGTIDAGDPDTGAVDAGGPDANDASQPDANDGAPVDAGCNDLSYGSIELPLTQNSGTAPAATGGTVANGTYNLSAYNYYGPTAPKYTLRSTVRINGNVIDRLITDATGIEKRQSGTFVTTGTTITMTWTCGVIGSDVGQYTAATNKFAFYPVSVLEAVHTK